MLGHCAGLRNSQELGDYVLAHAYLREDHVLDADVPVTVPIPALAEVQVALEQAVGEITHLEGIETKRIMRTGTVATFDNRIGSCATRPRSPASSASRAPWRSIWNRPPSLPTASASASPTAPCSASPTSRCMAS